MRRAVRSFPNCPAAKRIATFLKRGTRPETGHGYKTEQVKEGAHLNGSDAYRGRGQALERKAAPGRHPEPLEAQGVLHRYDPLHRLQGLRGRV